MDIVKQLQERMGYPSLKKVDPNTQDIPVSEEPVNRMGQAVIPTALIALQEWSTTDRGAEMILRENYYPDWGILLFGTNHSRVTTQIAEYANSSQVEAETKLKAAFAEAVTVLREDRDANEIGDIQDYFSAERQNILSHLPGQLHVGKYLNHESIDDQTHKMEGPVSSLLHKAEELFSPSDRTTEEDPDTKK